MIKKYTIHTENSHFELKQPPSSAIKVLGVGGGGSNAVSHMFQLGINGVDFVICNTDAQALKHNPVPVKIQLGASITEGLGAGGDPEMGEKSALDSVEDIKKILDTHTKMTFITAGMGGGTGTGAAPIIAGISKEMGILTVGIVTMPFYFEGRIRLEQAQKGIEKLRKHVDALIIINNDQLRELYGNLGFKAGFAKADEVLSTAAKGIAEVITHHYKQNIDLRDARTVLKNSGTTIMGSSSAVGENRAKEAVSKALDSPLLNDNKITGAKNVLLLIVSGKIEITIDEIGIISDYIQSESSHMANIIMGIGEEEKLEDHISVTVIATGFPTDIQRMMNHDEKKIFHCLDIHESLEKHEIQKDYVRYSTEHVNMRKSQKKNLYAGEKRKQQNYTDPDLEQNSLQEKVANTVRHPGRHIGIEDIFTTKKILYKENKKSNLRFSDVVDKSIGKNENFTSWTDQPKEPKNIQLKVNKTRLQHKIVDHEEYSGKWQDILRKKQLKNMNFQFNTSLSTEEWHNIPAYKRQGITLDAPYQEAPYKKEHQSPYIIEENGDGETISPPNNRPA